ncbi:MAG: U32 family peptidase [Bacteroidales bacterium]|nr:U32 family peptidase [Bacteroidales bacterium]
MNKLQPEQQKQKLLLPAGNRESFYAALEAGADAVYLGLSNFNARRRASNFSENNLSVLLSEAHQHHAKVFVTLNIVVKNRELTDLLNTLQMLERHRVDGIIIQDWGVYFLAKRYFPALPLHASTQMAIHNSVGVQYCAEQKFSQVILARELTMSELQRITAEATLPVEIFVHGALCYSMSGLCLFSSFKGGNSANRGLCTQPCRRFYAQNGDKKLIFSLKDNQQVEKIRQFEKLGISTLKVEGRLKPADYVYKVGKAYREILDDFHCLNDSKTALEQDFGREKTGFFLDNNIADVFTNHAATGVFLGEVVDSNETGFALRPTIPITEKNRLFIQHPNDDNQDVVKVKTVKHVGDFEWVDSEIPVKIGSRVFLASQNSRTFPNRFPNVEPLRIPPLPPEKSSRILQSLIPWQEKPKETEYWIRIAQPEWLDNIYIKDYQKVILYFDKTTIRDFSLNAATLKAFSQRFWMELPAFIPESDLDFWATQCRKMDKLGIGGFVVNQLAQTKLLPEKAHFGINENGYAFNDAAIAFFMRQRADFWIYPLENDMNNLIDGKDRNGVVNLFFYPKLFYARTPVKMKNNEWFSDENGENSYRKYARDGVTIVVPQHPVCLFQHRQRLENEGFSRFLIDLTEERTNKFKAKNLLQNLKNGISENDSTTFNFERKLF